AGCRCEINRCWRGFFFFQAEGGIRDFHVTGVQTCALPISTPEAPPDPPPRARGHVARRDPSAAEEMGHRRTRPAGVPGILREAEIGRASCRERQYIPEEASAVKRNHNIGRPLGESRSRGTS